MACQASHANVFIPRPERKSAAPRQAFPSGLGGGTVRVRRLGARNDRNLFRPPSARLTVRRTRDRCRDAAARGPASTGMAGRDPPSPRAGRPAPRGDDPGGEGRPAGQPVGGQQPGGRARCRGHRPAGGTDAGRVRRIGHGATGRGEPARARAPHPGVRQRAGLGGRGRGRAGPPATHRHRSLPVRHPRARARGVPDRVHGVRRHGVSRRHRLGRDLGPRSGPTDGRDDRP